MKLAVRTLVVAALLACASAHAQSPAAAAGQIAVGSKPYAVQASIAGAGRYTVIFESGFGTGLSAWRKVAPELAKDARVVTYSRAGHGTSEARPKPRTIAQNTNELEQLIAAQKLAPPFILVGHSYGGLLARAYAARHPTQVAGLVLVDPSDERFNAALRKLDAKRAADDDAQFAAIVPPKFKPELALLQPVLDGAAPPYSGKLPDVPTVVLTSVQQAGKPMFFLETADAVAIKKSLHADFLRQFSKGSQVVTEKSGHNIQLEEPELVIAAVREVIALADQKGVQAAR
ncbi:alpha/beta fold hydrolase [Massilia agri]|uniref:Alpha/beta hydrolase n=1 Tax=Massilia agri TaxID=1886785 RepID=A0ABT2AGW3_9BURK|nr:alpha/beta hydrolase [Massilia agri]MCS0595275.1 alpha/beta hydrolase [Massilia agri]